MLSSSYHSLIEEKYFSPHTSFTHMPNYLRWLEIGCLLSELFNTLKASWKPFNSLELNKIIFCRQGSGRLSGFKLDMV